MYKELEIWEYSIAFNTGGGVHAYIWGPKFNLNQYLGSVNYNMDENSISWVHKSEKGRIVEFSKMLDSIFGVPKTLGLIFRGQQRNIGMDPPY